MKSIGFIGVGVMGSGMVRNLLAAKFKVTIYSRTKAKAQSVLELGANWANSPAGVTDASDIVITMLGFPTDVETVWLGDQGIFSTDVSDKIIIDMSTSTPTLAIKLAQIGAEKHAEVLDAPVSGGDTGAKNGTLSIMVGGSKSAFDASKLVFDAMGNAARLFGKPGSGQHAKMANQIMVAGTMTGLTEMLVYSKSAGLDLTAVLATVGAGAAGNWSLTNYGPRILATDFAPGFYVKHFVKDLKIALDEAAKMQLDLPATKEAAKLYELLAEAGHADEGTQSLIQLYQ